MKNEKNDQNMKWKNYYVACSMDKVIFIVMKV